MAPVAKGGRPVYGEAVGILMLDTTFPRITGDIGNARTFPFPVRYHVVRGATTDEVVADADRAHALLPAFIEGARALEADGVKAITTLCGFLTAVQEALAEAVSVPVLTSSLFLVPIVRQMVAGRPIGVITAHAGHLSERHFRVCGIAPDWDIAVRGMDGSPCFTAAILSCSANVPELDVAGVSAEVVAVCQALVADRPDLAALVFECTNLQPYAQAVQAATGLPIFGIYHLVQMLHGAAQAPRFDMDI